MPLAPHTGAHASTLLGAWAQVIERGHDGYVAKDEATLYEAGPTRRWLKVKQRGGFGADHVGGLRPSSYGKDLIAPVDCIGDKRNWRGDE